METALKSHIGCVRQLNEDHGSLVRYDHGWVLAVVADGMGGHKAGDVASQMAVKAIQREMAAVMEDMTPEETRQMLEKAMIAANGEVFQYAEEHEECHGMGTTVVAALVTPSWGVIGHIGDSRIYKQTGNELVLLTQDHTLVNELQKNGQITAEEARIHPQRNVLIRALGTDQQVHIDTLVMEWTGEEALLLCTDGLTNRVSHEQLHQILLEGQTVEDQADALVQTALAAGGDDNITVIIVRNRADTPQAGERGEAS